MSRRPLAHVIQQLTNRPLLTTEDHACVIVSALRSELNINLLIDVEGRRLDEAAMDRMAVEARSRAGARIQAREEKYKIFQQIDNIALIPIQGTLMKSWGLEPYSGCTGYDGIRAKLIAALEDETVEGIFLDIDSPGGQAAGMLDLSDAIYSSSERFKGGKPIWGIADEYAASAAFGLGSAADKLFVNRTGVVGSVGVVAIYMNIKQALEDAGIYVKVFRAGTKKYKLNEYEDPDKETVDRFQAEIETVRDLFVATVARNLGLSEKKVADTEGLSYMGDQARAIGFVSAILSWDQAWTKFTRYLENR